MMHLLKSQNIVIKELLTMFLLVSAAAAGSLADPASSDPVAVELTSKDPASLPSTVPEPDNIMPEGLAQAMGELQFTSELIHKFARDRVMPREELDTLYRKMGEALDDIMDFMDYPHNAYRFLKAQGFDKIITPNLDIQIPEIRSRLLRLTKVLFEIAPTTTKEVIPMGVLDALLQIFEQDDNLVMKNYAMEVLAMWLPGSPLAQERVMVVKGLEPFYEQISKLDRAVISKILQLFYNIINEHLAARNKKIRKSKADYINLKLYQKIGLIEQISTPRVCQGLLNIFQEIWAFNTASEDVLPTVLDLLQVIKPHCFRNYKGQSQAMELIDQMLKFVQNPNNQEYFDKLQVNVTEITDFFNDFAEKVKSRDEL